MDNQPPAEMIEHIKDIPLYRRSIEKKYFPILEKPDLAKDFPDNWMTPTLSEALATGAAEFVLSTGTNHSRMQIIRPPYFLLHSYYQLWRAHPDIQHTWQQHCPRISITTMLATEHVTRVNKQKLHVNTPDVASLALRRLDERTFYLNQTLDPAHWSRAEIECMLEELNTIAHTHPQGHYHLDCSSYHLAHFMRKVDEYGLAQRFPQPESIIHAYEYTPHNIKQYLLKRFDCPVIDLFGSTELGYLYYSDRHGHYNPFLDKMHIELVPFSSSNRIYSLIVSSVRNPYMPLIRYRSGDCVQTHDDSPDPNQIMRFCGREKEMLITPQRIVSHADVDDLIRAASNNIFIFQLQRDENKKNAAARLRYVTFNHAPLSNAAATHLQRELSTLIEQDCTIESCSHIPIGRSGKYAWLTPLSQ